MFQEFSPVREHGVPIFVNLIYYCVYRVSADITFVKNDWYSKWVFVTLKVLLSGKVKEERKKTTDLSY